MPASNSTLSRLKADCCLLPSLQTERTKSLLLCRRIAYVQVGTSVKIDGVACYTLQISDKKPTSNIPTRRQRHEHRTDQYVKPDRVTYQRFSAFASLSRELSYHAHAGHASRGCTFCKVMTRTLGSERPRLRTKLFHGDTAIHKELERFINTMLSLVQDGLHPTSNNCCDGQHEAPILLARFLTEWFDPSRVYSTRCDGPKASPVH